MKIRDIIRLIEEDGWYLVSTKGSHRQFKHPFKIGRVTVAGQLGYDMQGDTLASIFRQAKIKLRSN